MNLGYRMFFTILTITGASSSLFANEIGMEDEHVLLSQHEGQEDMAQKTVSRDNNGTDETGEGLGNPAEKKQQEFSGPSVAELQEALVNKNGLFVGKPQIQEGPEFSFERVFRSEPTFEQLLEAAWRQADVDIKGGSRWRPNMKRSTLLPILKITTKYEIDRDESLDRYQDEPDKWGADTDRDWGIQVSMQWHLSELIYNPEELKIYSALVDRAARREALTSLLVGYYYERKRLIVTRYLASSQDRVQNVMTKIRIEELTSIIDALTGGLLSRNLQKATE